MVLESISYAPQITGNRAPKQAGAGSGEVYVKSTDTLQALGEFALIKRIAPGCIIAPSRVVQGIGDDCAATRGAEGTLHLVTTDMLVERVHFLRDAITPRQLGAKAVAVNLSDIAAMGGIPLDAYVSLAIPDGISLAFVDELYEGMRGMASRFGVNILGGDTTGSRADLIVSITVTGQVEEALALYRSGARPGDILYLTGPLGDAAAGLYALTAGMAADDLDARALATRHHEPIPHLAQGRFIAESTLAHAMIDVSDGLSGDLGHVCDRSGVGCEVEEEALPVSDELKRYARHHGLDAVGFTLHGGEDYVLLAAGSEDLAAAAVRRGIDLYPIGTISDGVGRRVRRADGTFYPLESRSWDHFTGCG